MQIEYKLDIWKTQSSSVWKGFSSDSAGSIVSVFDIVEEESCLDAPAQKYTGKRGRRHNFKPNRAYTNWSNIILEFQDVFCHIVAMS